MLAFFIPGRRKICVFHFFSYLLLSQRNQLFNDSLASFVCFFKWNSLLSYIRNMYYLLYVSKDNISLTLSFSKCLNLILIYFLNMVKLTIIIYDPIRIYIYIYIMRHSNGNCTRQQSSQIVLLVGWIAKTSELHPHWQHLIPSKRWNYSNTNSSTGDGHWWCFLPPGITKS